MTEISIILPGYRHANWKPLYDSAVESCNGVPFEMIIVGPKGNIPELENIPNFKFIEDYGSPVRCAQIAVSNATGRVMVWASDDGTFVKDALRQCYLLLMVSGKKDGIITRYREGGNFPDDSYWTVNYHSNLKLPGVPGHYKIAPVGMYYLDYFKKIGGWDCRYEHLNMCNHDLAFRVQNDGGQLHLSPTEVLTCSWVPWDGGDGSWIPVKRAYFEVDLPLFNSMYSVDQSTRIKIDFNNWKDSPAKWEKRFGA